MNATEYILGALGDLAEKFPQIRARYEYDRRIESHFIEVIPNDVYHLDDAYIAWENNMTDEFIALFPTQNICFISDDAVVGIRNTEYIIEGLEFAPISVDKQPSVTVAPNEITIAQVFIQDMGDTITLVKSEEEVLFSHYRIPASPDYRLAA